MSMVENYVYLFPVMLGALSLILLVVRWLPRLNNSNQDNRKYELIVLGLILLVGVAAIYGRFFLGDAYYAYQDTGDDTVNQYVPFYIHLIESLQDGTFGAWNFEFGLGTTYLSHQSWLLDPFNLILIPLTLVIGVENLSISLVVVQSIKIMLSGFLFNRLAVRYCRVPISRILGSSLFAFSGYLLLWGQHYWLGGVYVAFVAFLLALEALIDRWTAPRFIAVAVLSAVVMIWSPYCGFMVLLGGAIYALIRLLYLRPSEHDAHFVLARTLRLCIPVFIGIVISSIALIPYALYLFGETSRTGSAEQASLPARMIGFLTQFVPGSWLPLIASRLLGNGMAATSADFSGFVSTMEGFNFNNTYEFISLGYSVASLILLLQFLHWVVFDGGRRVKFCVGIAATLVILFCVNSFLPAFFNIFVNVKYRSAFVIAVPICLALAVGWEQRVQCKKIAFAPLLAGVALSLAICVWTVLNNMGGRLLPLLSGFLVAFIGALLVVAKTKPTRFSAPLVAVLCAAIIGSSVLDGLFVVNRRATCTNETFPGASSEPDAATRAALDYLRTYDDGLYRVDKAYYDWGRFNDALVEGYMSASGYNSMTDGDVVSFYRTFWPVADLWGVGAYQSFIEDPDAPVQASVLGMRYVLACEKLSFDWLEPVTQVDGIWIHRCSGTWSLLSAQSNTVAESDVLGMGSIEERLEALASAVIVPDDASVAGTRLQANQASFDYPQWSSVVTSQHFEQPANDTIQGEVSTSSDGVACMAVPYTDGWRVEVDGKQVKTFRANVGFIGFNLSAGDHEVRMHYEVPGLGLGAAVSAAGVLVLFATALLMLKTRKG